MKVKEMRKNRGLASKRASTSNENFVPRPCPNCRSTTHRSTRSRECPAHTKSTDEILKESLGEGFESFTRCCTFDRAVKEPYRVRLRTQVHDLSAYLRAVVTRTQLFVNQFILDHDTVPPICFTQNFFYSVMQLVIGKSITTNNSRLPDDLETCWTQFQSQYASLTETPATSVRSSDLLSEACVLLQTA